jgi:hypothetical protein
MIVIGIGIDRHGRMHIAVAMGGTAEGSPA